MTVAIVCSMSGLWRSSMHRQNGRYWTVDCFKRRVQSFTYVTFTLISYPTFFRPGHVPQVLLLRTTCRHGSVAYKLVGKISQQLHLPRGHDTKENDTFASLKNGRWRSLKTSRSNNTPFDNLHTIWRQYAPFPLSVGLGNAEISFRMATLSRKFGVS